MISREMEIKIPSGLDPSTIALFIQIASQYDSSVYGGEKQKGECQEHYGNDDFRCSSRWKD